MFYFFAWLVTDIGENAQCNAETPSRRKGNIELAGRGFPIGSPRCVTTAFKMSGRGLRRLATNSPRDFGTCTRGFAAAEDAGVAVCVLPGTELAFSSPVTVTDYRFVVAWKVELLGHATAIFRQVNKNEPMKHHDALEFPDGRIVLLTRLSEGQVATVLQLPAQPMTTAEADAQKRIAYVG
jgi:hypothetical protein